MLSMSVGESCRLAAARVAVIATAVITIIAAQAYGAISLPNGPVHVILRQGSKTLVNATAPIPPGFAFDGTEAIDLHTSTPGGNSSVILKIDIESPTVDFTAVHFYLRSVDDPTDPNGIGIDGLLDALAPIDTGQISVSISGLNFFPNVVATVLVPTDAAAAFYMLVNRGLAGSFVKLPGGVGFPGVTPGQVMWQVPMLAFWDADPSQYNFWGSVNPSPAPVWAAVPNPIDAGFGLVDVATGQEIADPEDGRGVIEIGVAAFYEVFAVIPEPATVSLFALAALVVLARPARGFRK